MKAIGVSNFTPKHLEQLAQDCADPQPMVNQVRSRLPCPVQADLLRTACCTCCSAQDV